MVPCAYHLCPRQSFLKHTRLQLWTLGPRTKETCVSDNYIKEGKYLLWVVSFGNCQSPSVASHLTGSVGMEALRPCSGIRGGSHQWEHTGRTHPQTSPHHEQPGSKVRLTLNSSDRDYLPCPSHCLLSFSKAWSEDSRCCPRPPSPLLLDTCFQST